MEVLLGEFHLPRVKGAYPRDFILLVNNSWRLPLCLGQNYIDEVLYEGSKSLSFTQKLLSFVRKYCNIKILE